jgi:DmsE family decaheme c-type cytochrome
MTRTDPRRLSGFLGCALACGLAMLAKDLRAAQAAPPAATDRQSGYVGADTCKVCHEEIYNSFRKTPHWKTLEEKNLRTEARGCEACHGPGEEHANSNGERPMAFAFKSASPAEVSGRCLQCHQSSQEHAAFERSTHATAGVNCMDCHSPHHAKQAQALLVEPQPSLCYTCHLEVKPDFQKPFHHRVNEHLIKCSDCHNAHGSFLSKQVRSTPSQDAMCLKCHIEKTGPFVFEHEPVKVEGCLACHQPHGSSNQHMLKRSQVNLLCLECHTDTPGRPIPGLPSFHDQTTAFQACTMCHAQIHGSNFDKDFFK